MKQLILNAFCCGGISNQCPGLWRLPTDRSYRFNHLDY
jgi:hypothetical protein